MQGRRRWLRHHASIARRHAVYRIDQLEEIVADFRHRALLHHGNGIVTAEMVFGTTLTTSTGR